METKTEVSKRLNTQPDANGQAMSQVTDAANNVIKQAKETINQGVEKVSKGTGEMYDSAIQYSRKNPGKALGIALGSGVAVGFMLGRSSKSRYDDSLWGAVTTAALRTVINRWR